jgi:hypothetical protein
MVLPVLLSKHGGHRDILDKCFRQQKGDSLEDNQRTLTIALVELSKQSEDERKAAANGIGQSYHGGLLPYARSLHMVKTARKRAGDEGRGGQGGVGRGGWEGGVRRAEEKEGKQRGDGQRGWRRASSDTLPMGLGRRPYVLQPNALMAKKTLTKAGGGGDRGKEEDRAVGQGSGGEGRGEKQARLFGQKMQQAKAPRSVAEWSQEVAKLRSAARGAPGLRSAKAYRTLWVIRAWLFYKMRQECIHTLQVPADTSVKQFHNVFPDQGSWCMKLSGHKTNSKILALFGTLGYNGPAELFTMWTCLFMTSSITTKATSAPHGVFHTGSCFVCVSIYIYMYIRIYMYI